MALTLALSVEIVHEAHAMLIRVAHVLALVHVVVEHAAGVAPLRAALVVAWVGRAAPADREARVAVSGSRASSARTKVVPRDGAQAERAAFRQSGTLSTSSTI